MRDAVFITASVTPEGSPKARVDVTDRALSLEYTDREVAADKLVLTVRNADMAMFSDPAWRKGNYLDVSWGYPGEMSIPRRTIIRKITGGAVMNIEAHGLEVLLNRQHRCRIFEHMSRSAAAHQIAREWGYADPAVLDIQDSGEVFEHLAQARMTDAQMLRSMARAEGYQWWIDHAGFHFRRRDVGQPTLRVIDLDGGDVDLTTFRVENNIAARPGSVVHRGRDPVERRTIDVRHDNGTEPGRKVLAAVVEAAGTKLDKLVPGFSRVATEYLNMSTDRTPTASTRRARGHFDAAQQSVVKIRLTIEGDPNLYAKTVVELRHAGKRLSGRYFVHEAKHVAKDGYRTELVLISDGSAGHVRQSEAAKELSLVQVGPGIKGHRNTDTASVRRDIDLRDAARKVLLSLGPDGEKVVKYLPPDNSGG